MAKYLRTLEIARQSGKLVFTNRPFAEGRLLHAGLSVEECMDPILARGFHGAILFGARSLPHLRDNLDSYN